MLILWLPDLCAGKEEQAMAAAVTATRPQANLQKIATNIHNIRLNRLLSINGMERKPVYGDGNCFFKAASFHLATHDETTLRQALCDHLMQHVLFYLGFFSNCHSAQQARQVKTCMRAPGVWNTTANDVVPLALANFTGRRVKLFTSKKQQPVVGITPSMPGVTCSVFQPVYMALLAPAGMPEHYDGCLAMHRHLYNVFGSSYKCLEGSRCTSDVKVSDPARPPEASLSHPATPEGSPSHPVTPEGSPSHPATPGGTPSHPVTPEGSPSDFSSKRKEQVSLYNTPPKKLPKKTNKPVKVEEK